MERSQISIAIILGVAVVLIISITLFISKTAEVKRTMQETAKSETTASEVKPIIRHLTSCLESTSETALTLLGKQGGYISQSQGGAFPDYTSQQAGVFFVPFLGQKVNYGISQQAVVLPDYPSLFFPYGPGPEARASSGIATLPPLNGSSFRSEGELRHLAAGGRASGLPFPLLPLRPGTGSQGIIRHRNAPAPQRVKLLLLLPARAFRGGNHRQLHRLRLLQPAGVFLPAGGKIRPCVPGPGGSGHHLILRSYHHQQHHPRAALRGHLQRDTGRQASRHARGSGIHPQQRCQ